MKTDGKHPIKPLTNQSLPKSFYELKARADKVWKGSPSDANSVSELLGSSDLDKFGQDYWLALGVTSFIAPNFFIERQDPVSIELLRCIKMGEDMDDRPLYYFCENGSYFISSDKGLLLVALSTHMFFEAFISYAEWVEYILDLYGHRSFIEFSFNADDLNKLEEKFISIFGNEYNCTFWRHEILRLKKVL